jgi:WD40 repeat protein
VASVAFSPDGKTIASGGADGKVRLWNPNGGGLAYSGSGAPIPGSDHQELATLTGHTGAVNSVAFSPDGHTLASGSSDTTVRLWNATTRRSIATLTGHTGPVNSVAFSPDAESLASGSSDMTVRLWNTFVPQGIATLTGHTGAVNSVTFNPYGTTIASGSADTTVRLWSTATQRGTATLTGHTAAVNSVAFSPDNTNFASGSSDTTVRLWNADALQSSTVLVNAAPVYAVAFSLYDGSGYALAAAVQETIQVWDTATQKTTMTLRGDDKTNSKYVTVVPINSLAFGTYGSIWDLVSGDSSGAINVWNPVT